MDAPERITVSVINLGSGYFDVTVDEVYDDDRGPWSAEYIRADLAQAAIQRARDQALEDAAKAVANAEIGFHDGISAEWRPYPGPTILSHAAATIRTMKGDTDDR